MSALPLGGACDIGPRDPAGPWAIVLAGGEGMRLRGFVREVFGDERPKQYLPLVDERSLLRQTLDRVALLVPPERTVVVTLQGHQRHVAGERLAGPTVLFQPENRDTALGILFPVHWIHRREPDATVVIFPSDHFILEEKAFMGHLAGVVPFVAHDPRWLVLLGLPAREPDPEYGWIEPGPALDADASTGIFRANRFREKPKPEVARLLLARGWLWNTFVLVAKVASLVAAGRAFLPDLHARLLTAVGLAGSRRERWALWDAYRSAPCQNFSRTVLEAHPHLAVSRLPSLLWSDLGTPARLLRLVRALRLRPPWLRQAQRLSAVSAPGHRRAG